MNRRVASLALALCACLACAAPAAADVVTIRSGLSPERARIVVGATVRWENATAAPQRVDSVDRPAFEDLAIRAGGSGERRFNRPGRYRYRVPGIGKDGDVIVRAAARRPRSSGRGCNRRDVFLYDVRVSAGKSGSETWLPRYNNGGEFAFSYRYSVRYGRLPVTVRHQCGSATTVSSPGGSGTGGGNQHPGSATLTSYIWRDSVVSLNPGPDGTTAPCGFNVATAGLGAQIRVEAYVPGSGGGSSFYMSSRLRPDQSDALDALLQARRDGVCDKGNPGLTNANVFDELPGHSAAGTVPIYEKDYRVAGLSLSPPKTYLNGDFTNPGVGFPAALRKLLRGDSFSVSSGRRTYAGTNSQTAAKAAASVRIEFSRAR